jgi:hypothetical protein
MSSPIDPSLLPATAQRVLAASAPKPMRLMAAKGVIPGLKPGDIVTVIAALGTDPDPDVAATALATFQKLPDPILTGALAADLPAAVTELFAEHYAREHTVIEQLLRMPRITGRALERLATAADERAGEIIATNEELLLQNPKVIEKLYMNKRVRMSTADRLLELAVRNGIDLDIPAYKEAAAAIQDQLIPEATSEPTFDDVLFQEVRQIAEKVVLSDDEDTHDVDDEGEETVRDKVLPLHTRIAEMTITQRIRCAMLGSSAERLLLMRDPNRLVSAAAAKSPLLREPEVVRVTASRNVSEDVLRILAFNREFTRNYQVKLNLVCNPRTPFSFASRLVPMLRDNDLRSLAKSKNVTGSISQSVKQQLLRKQGKKDD